MIYGLDMIKEHGWFKNHKVTSHSPEFIVWTNPGTSVYRVDYALHGVFLVVLGDMGEAVYQWSQAISWEFLNGLDFSYFHSKCRASPTGFPWNDWCSRRAKEYLEDLFKEDDSLDECDLQKSLAHIDFRADWDEFMREEGCAVFGADWCELSVGVVPALQCVGHWYGLQLATDFVLGKEPNERRT